MKTREVVKRLKAAGWTEDAPRGRHSVMMLSPDGRRKVPIPNHKGKDVNGITLKRIEKETGITMR
jgi:predicted RNA binding protein YcfA (HicA-like mRNA interferase family)